MLFHLLGAFLLPCRFDIIFLATQNIAVRILCACSVKSVVCTNQSKQYHKNCHEDKHFGLESNILRWCVYAMHGCSLYIIREKKGITLVRDHTNMPRPDAPSCEQTKPCQAEGSNFVCYMADRLSWTERVFCFLNYHFRLPVPSS